MLDIVLVLGAIALPSCVAHGDADKNKSDNNVQVLKYSSYDDSDHRPEMFPVSLVVSTQHFFWKQGMMWREVGPQSCTG